MKPRTWHYAYHPSLYQVACPNCADHNITWSEWQEHLWCYECEKDIKIENSILNGPIPTTVANAMGIKFDRVIIATGKLDVWDVDCNMYASEIKKIRSKPQLKGFASKYPDIYD